MDNILYLEFHVLAKTMLTSIRKRTKNSIKHL